MKPDKANYSTQPTKGLYPNYFPGIFDMKVLFGLKFANFTVATWTVLREELANSVQC